MTKIGDDIIHNCPKCYREKGFSTKLASNGNGELVCEYDSGHRFRVEKGMIKEI